MSLVALARRAIKSLNALAPVGYEDDEGFHFGGVSQE